VALRFGWVAAAGIPWSGIEPTRLRADLIQGAAERAGSIRPRESAGRARDQRIWQTERRPPHFWVRLAERTTSPGGRGVKAFVQWHPPERERSFCAGTAVGPMGVRHRPHRYIGQIGH